MQKKSARNLKLTYILVKMTKAMDNTQSNFNMKSIPEIHNSYRHPRKPHANHQKRNSMKNKH